MEAPAPSDAWVRRVVALDGERTCFEAASALSREPDDFEVLAGPAAGAPEAADPPWDGLALRDPTRAADGRFNRVLGLGAAHLALLPALEAWYAARGLPCRVELTPEHATGAVLAALQGRGYRCERFLTLLHARLPGAAGAPPPPGSSRVVIDRVSRVQVDLAFDLMRAALGLDPPPPAMRARAAPWYQRPDYRLYLARVDGTPAALGPLFVRGGLAWLGDPWVLPTFFQRGAQLALLQHAVALAAEDGCEAVVADAAFGSPRHRWLEAAGLHVAWLTSRWVRPPG